MNTYITILRGINLGGHQVIKMDALKKFLAEIGYMNVRTYIQSGNVVYQHEAEKPEEINAFIKKKLVQEFGFDISVISLTIDEWKKVIRRNPFSEKDESFVHITFLAGVPLAEKIDAIKGGDYGQDEFRLIEKTVYLYCPNGYGRTKLSNSFFERKLKVTATTRNWKTVNALLVMATETENL